MSKSSCRFVVTKKDDCCYKTTTETVVGLYGVAVPAFPTSSTKDSVHVVRYDDALVTYAYNGTAWIETTNTPITSSVTPGVLVDNGDGTYTWTDTATTFVIDTVDRVLSTVVYSAATQDFTFTWSNGDTTVVDLTGLLNVYSLLGGNNTVVTGNGVSIPWEVNGYGVADNSDGTFTVTLPDGVTTFLIDTNETVTNIVGNTYTNEAGTAQAIVQTVVNTVTGNNLTTTVNGVSSTSVALPADIVTTLAATLDTTNPLAPTLVITYVNENGTNAIQNVKAPLYAGKNKLSSKEIDQRAKELLNMVGLSHRETHKPGELSGGEQQRVAIARALINKPKILVADEPTGNLDAKTGKEILDLMQKVSKEMHLTIIMATHNNEIAKLADRVVKISDGIIANE